MLEELLDLRKPQSGSVGHIPQTAAGTSFLALLDTDSDAFEEVSQTVQAAFTGSRTSEA